MRLPLVRAVTAALLVAGTAVAAAVTGGASSQAAAGARCPWVQSSASIPDRVGQVMAHMSIDDEIALVHGRYGSPYSGDTPALDALCIPALNYNDGPAGVAHWIHGVTQLPAPIALASTWDTQAAQQYGTVLGGEEIGKGALVTLAPTVNLVRDPRWGRSFEALGEDPILNGLLGAAIVRGIQGRGSLAQIKHYAAYNQETYRNTAADDAIVAKRVLQEMYLKTFRTAITNSAPASVMCSYSYVNNIQACANHYLLTHVLRDQMGFDGFVTSDWTATNSVAAAQAGLDVEMPGGVYLAQALREEVDSGRLPRSTLDTMVRRILTEMFAFGLFNRPPVGSKYSQVTSSAHIAATRELAAEGMVLLKNSRHILPLSTAKSQTFAGIGSAASADAVYDARGSANVLANYDLSPLKGLRRRAGKSAKVVYNDGSSLSSAAAAAKRASVAIVFLSRPERENADLPNLRTRGANRLVSHVAAANPNTVVVLNTGSANVMPWLSKVKAVVQAWYPGQEYGAAIASVLFGDTNPSGHLPISFPRRVADLPAHTQQQWPGANGTVQYSEGLRIGYRWYDGTGIQPLFPFGFGLSYTAFRLTNMSVSGPNRGGDITVKAHLTNVGDRAGSDVVQLYARYPHIAQEPPKLLERFARVTVRAHHTVPVVFHLNQTDLTIWNGTTGTMTNPTGIYRLLVGDSAVNLPLRAAIRVNRPNPWRTVTVFSPGPQDSTLGQSVKLDIGGRDSGGSSLRWRASGLPHGLSIDRSSGEITGTPRIASTSTVTVTAADGWTSGSTTFTYTVNPAYRGPTGIITGLTGKCLNVRSAAAVNRTPVSVYGCNGSNSQEWTVRYDGTIRALGMCLDVAGGGGANRTPVDLYSCNGTSAQHWSTASDGSIRAASGMCLDIPGGSATSGTQVQIYSCNGSSAQRWRVPQP